MGERGIEGDTQITNVLVHLDHTVNSFLVCFCGTCCFLLVCSDTLKVEGKEQGACFKPTGCHRTTTMSMAGWLTTPNIQLIVILPVYHPPTFTHVQKRTFPLPSFFQGALDEIFWIDIPGRLRPPLCFFLVRKVRHPFIQMEKGIERGMCDRQKNSEEKKNSYGCGDKERQRDREVNKEG